MFQAAFGYSVRTSLVPIEGDPEALKGGVTARVYQAVLDRYLPLILGLRNIFIQDNTLIHKAYIIRDWFVLQGIDVMDQPLYSPDLNLIKNLQALLKEKMYILHLELVGIPNNTETLDLLIRCAIDTQDRLGEELLNRLIDTIVHRVKAVLDTEGWYTKY